ncbi:indoleamine 2,3-dioxygenase 2-like [Plakobranchus ocellatus]|uniref:Indoleamine 2,3-dioxygenase 2-like n=1 Tax=Plakobranchus ocellatus TaxID=259542 RepID=A0AAV3YY72_9GAST|nr:indoleamine 2,3-dioxygenase 2-like [Plakobranchus ocellatus]
MALPEFNREIANDVWDFKNYQVDFETGFMLPNPLESLPPYFDSWNKLATNLPDLVKEKKFRDEVYKLPLLNHNLLEGCKQLRLAHLQLSFIASAFVWQDGEKEATKVLPKCVAVPYFNVSKILGIPPILSHASLVLTNWGLINPNGNLKCLYRMPGEAEAEWFVMVTAHVEFTFAKCLKPIIMMLSEIKTIRESKSCVLGTGFVTEAAALQVAQHLDALRECISELQGALSRMHEKLTAKTFFNVLRPFLGGWGGEGNPLPEGLIYEGISENPMKMTGGSAAQSSSMQILDAFLGVQHTEEKREFLVHMRDFMPTEHRRLIEDLEKWPHKLRDVVLSSKSPTLRQSYNNCVQAVVNLRTYHMQIVTKYIVTASKEANEGNYESLDNKGTGGTSLIPFLKVIRSDTQQKLVSEKEPFQKSCSKQNFSAPAPFYRSTVLLFMAVVSIFAAAIFVRSVQQ